MAEERAVDLGTHTLRVLDSGGDAPTLLCLHGLVDTLEIWDAAAPAMAARGRLIRVDQRGHGGSGAPAGATTRRDMARDVLGVLDGLRVERSVLIGHSMGGIVSMETALFAPGRVAGLVLVGTAARCNEKTARWYERIACAGEAEGTEGLARAIYGRGTRRAVHGDARGIASVTRMLKSLYEDPLTVSLGEIRCPTLLLVGEDDPMGSRASERIAQALGPERASLERLPGLGHWVHVEAPDVFAERTFAWLARGGLEETR